MRMSNTKPIKNTMRKSPVKQTMAGKVDKNYGAKKEVKPTVKTGGTKPVPTATTKTAAATTPAMQLKKRKC